MAEQNNELVQVEWRRLYEAVASVCRERGQENAFGEGDFWLVDDCWGTVGQKLEVHSPRFITRDLVRKLQSAIEVSDTLGAEVLVSLNFVTKLGLPPMGLTVYASGVDEYWDLAQIRERLGEDFYG